MIQVRGKPLADRREDNCLVSKERTLTEFLEEGMGNN